MSKTDKKDIAKSLDLIKEWNKHLNGRIRDEKYKKMAQTPYYFYRGTNFLFWNYFSNDERLKKYGNDKTKTWIQADLHAYNFGIYDNEDGELVYGLNDFDEACVADYQFDIWRMAASMLLIAAENGFDDEDKRFKFIESFTNGYLSVIENYRLNGSDVLFQVNKKNAFGKLDEVLERTEKKEGREEMLRKWTKKENGKILFDTSYHKLADISEIKKNEVIAAVEKYLQTLTHKIFPENYFKVIDVAQRISSGTGSYGTPRYYILINGSGKENEQHILDAKFQYKPCAYSFLDDKFRKIHDSMFINEGQRHKEAYLALSAKVDPHLGWLELSEGIFSVRERSPFKSYFPTEILTTETRFKKLAMQWGSVLATAHIKGNKQFAHSDILDVSKQMKKEFAEHVFSIAKEFVDYSNKAYDKFINKFFLNAN